MILINRIPVIGAINAQPIRKFVSDVKVHFFNWDSQGS